MIDLTTTYLGLSLKNPLVASSSPLTANLDNIRRMEDAGVAAIVMHSLFEEQITLEVKKADSFLGAGLDSGSFGESLSDRPELSGIFLPDVTTYNAGPEGYLEHLFQAKRAVSIPIIASLNGFSRGPWTKFALKMQEAGADAIELNTYYLPTDTSVTSDEVEQMYCDLVKQVKSKIQIPLAVKLSPYFTAFANVASRLDGGGADSLVLFNRFYQPDFDLERLEVLPNLGLSSSQELPLRLHWLAILYKNVKCDLAATGGIHTDEDVVKAITAGAQVVMMTSALLKKGIDHFGSVLADLGRWIERHKLESIREVRGTMAMPLASDISALERANYVRLLSSGSLRRPDKPDAH